MSATGVPLGLALLAALVTAAVWGAGRWLWWLGYNARREEETRWQRHEEQPRMWYPWDEKLGRHVGPVPMDPSPLFDPERAAARRRHPSLYDREAEL